MSTESPDRLETRERQVLYISGYGGGAGVKPGSFYEHLIRAFFAADRRNLMRLRTAFPITGQAYFSYISGVLTEKYNLKEAR
jgi:hypothetical protein